MMLKTWIGLVVVALAAAGCGDDTVEPNPMGQDAGVLGRPTPNGPPEDLPIPSNDTGEGAYFMTLSTVGVALATGQTSAGFNLDGIVSDGTTDCEAPDFTSPDGQPGIDNALSPFVDTLLGNTQLQQLIVTLIQSIPELTGPGGAFEARDFSTQPLVPGDINALVSNLLTTNDEAILVELKGADSTQDGEVTLTILAGQTDSGEPPNLDSSGKIAPNQLFDIDSDSYRDGTAGMMPLISFTGEIINGELFIGPIDISAAALGFDISDFLDGLPEDLDVVLSDAQLAARFTANGLEGGRAAGAIDLGDLRRGACIAGIYDLPDPEDPNNRFARDCPPDATPAPGTEVPDDATLLRLALGILEGQADIIDNAMPANPPIDPVNNCERLSVGLTFEAVPSTRGAIVDDNVAPPEPGI